MSEISTPEVWIVQDAASLRRMEKLGWIAKPPEHVRPRGASWGKRGYHYVDDTGELGFAWKRHGEFEYRIKYFDGCFYPFVLQRPYQERRLG